MSTHHLVTDFQIFQSLFQAFGTVPGVSTTIICIRYEYLKS